MSLELLQGVLISVLRLSTPLIYGALAAAVCEKAGLLNMAIEGMLLFSALAGVVFSGWTQSAFLGLIAAIAVGAFIGLLIAYTSFTGKADLLLTNIALNLAAAGGTVFILFALTGDKSTSAVTIASKTLPDISIPLIRDIPFLGPILSGQNILTYLAFLITFLIAFMFKRTRIGLRMRAIGENAKAVESVGISATRVKYIAYTLSGALAGMGGAFMSMGYMSSFGRNMTAGRGYISLSAMNVAGGSPVGSMLASLLFGGADAVANTMQTSSSIPTDFILMIPYATTILGLVSISVIKKQKRKARFANKEK